MKHIDPREVLRAFVERYPTQRAAAAALQISQPYLGDMLKGNRRLSDTILHKLGLHRTEIVTKKAS